MRAAIYTRVSSEEQVKGYSLDTQRTALEAWAAREGWEVVARYEDAGFSAASIEGRPAFMRMLSEASGFDVLLVLKQDRFARDIADAFMAERALQRAGARVLYHDEPGANDGETPAGLIVKAVGYAGAQGYRMDLSRKIARGYATMADKGLHVGDVPFGYRRDDPKAPMEPDEHEAEGVRWAFETYGTGTVSLAQVADGLAARGHRPHSKRGRQTFALSTVSTMLKSRVYLGEVYYRGAWYPGLHEPIVTPDLYNAAQVAAATRKRAPRAYSPANRTYLLSGIGECASCQSGLWSDVSGSGHRYYRCSTRHSRAECRDKRRGARADQIEGRIERMVLRTAELVPELDSLIREEAERFRPVDVDAERARHEQTIRRATQAMIAGGDEETARAAIAEARRALAALDAAPRAPLATATLAGFADLWPHFEPQERQEAARLMFARVSVDLAGRDVMFQPRPEYEAPFSVVASLEGAPISHVCDKVGVVRPGGFEPPASASAGQRSIP